MSIQKTEYLMLKVHLQWKNHFFCCMLQTNISRYDFTLPEKANSFKELGVVYDLLINLNEPCSVVDEFAHKFHLDYLHNIYAIIFYKACRRIFENIKLMGVEFIDTLEIDPCGQNQIISKPLQIFTNELSLFNQIVVVANDLHTLNKIMLHNEVLQFIPKLPKVSPIRGMVAINNGSLKYILQANDIIYCVNEISSRIYLQVKVQIDGNNTLLYITENIVKYFAKVIFGEDVIVSGNLFMAQSVIDILFSRFNLLQNLKFTFIDFQYTTMNTGDYIQFNFEVFSTNINGLIFLKYCHDLDCSSVINIIGQYFKEVAKYRCINNNMKLEFYLDIHSFTMNICDINNIEAGDVVILDNNLHMLRDEILQNGIINLGASTIKYKLINENQIQIIG